MVSSPSTSSTSLPVRVSALIAVSALSHELASATPPVVLDVRWSPGQPSQLSAYLTGHIPGAQWCDLDADLASPPGPAGRHPLPDPMELQQRLQQWGIDADSAVVVYDADTSIGAARAWWVLRWAGLASVRVLNGGFLAWVQADQAIQTDVTIAAAGSMTVRRAQLPVIDAAVAQELAQAGRLIDVRTAERYRGDVEPMDRVAGRVPGAINIPAAELMNSDGSVKSPAAVVARLREAGIDPGAGLGVYCGSGVTASHTVLALTEANVDVRLYPGSWSEWIADPSRPVATGP